MSTGVARGRRDGVDSKGMRLPGWRRGTGLWLAGLALVTLALLPACGLDHKRPAPDDNSRDLSADRLDFADESPFLEDLDPAERSAAERSGLAVPAVEDDPPASESKSNTAGKVGISVLSVALSVGAAVAPFFLF
jgi:hypothetical protein